MIEGGSLNNRALFIITRMSASSNYSQETSNAQVWDLNIDWAVGDSTPNRSGALRPHYYDSEEEDIFDKALQIAEKEKLLSSSSKEEEDQLIQACLQAEKENEACLQAEKENKIMQQYLQGEKVKDEDLVEACLQGERDFFKHFFS
ncbi:uncharacterized protein [Rhodnius prolixus]|uniref:uncharacterized protein n=1 Tax=Rhodnius prolixus TaxID=13249 RepID=UPI003D18DF7C